MMYTIKLLILKMRLRRFEKREAMHSKLGNTENWYKRFGIPDLKNEIDLVLYNKKKRMFDESLRKQHIEHIKITENNGSKLLEINYSDGFNIREYVK